MSPEKKKKKNDNHNFIKMYDEYTKITENTENTDDEKGVRKTGEKKVRE